MSAAPRIARLAPGGLDPEQRRLYDEIVGGPRGQGAQAFPLTAEDGGLLGPFNALLLSPQVGTALQSLGSAIRFASTLSPRTRELAILTVAHHHRSRFEREAHEAVARSIGISDAELADLRAGDSPVTSSRDEVTAIAFTRALLVGDVADEQWQVTVGAIGERAIFELVALVGYYSSLALQLRVFRVDPASGGAAVHTGSL